MALSESLYFALLSLVALGRLVELVRSRRNQQQLARAGSTRSPEPAYRWMVALHASILIGAAVEVAWLHRPWTPWLGIPSVLLFVLANVVRWWVIRTLGPRWNVRVMSISSLGIIAAKGPYKWVRHPNYTAVFVEMLALPLVHSAYFVALAGAVLHVFVLRARVGLEESVLMQDAGWRTAFAHLPRFIPGVSSSRVVSSGVAS